MRRIPVRAGDIMLGDRAYANPVAVAYVQRARADLVTRFNRQSLPLYRDQEERVQALGLFRKLRVAQPQQWATRVKTANGWVPGRLIGVKRSAEATQAARRRLEIRAKKQQRKVSRETWEMAQYFAVWTSLGDSFSAAAVLDLYRFRWQIELAFKRMKSILGLGHLPKKDPVSARAWLHGKIFVSLLAERMVEAADKFSPWGYRLDRSAESLEGNGIYVP